MTGTDTGPRSSVKWRFARSVVIATLAMAAITSIALVIYTRGSRAPQEYVLEIPDGSSALIAAGENPLDIPKEWTFLADDTLTLVNNDSADHYFGTFLAPAGQTVSYVLQPALGGLVFCSLHPSGTIDIGVEVRDFDWRLLVAPTLIFGPAIGIVVFVATQVMRKLDDEDDDARWTEAERPVAQPSDSI